MIRMNGPVIERRRRGGALTTGLDMVHLARWLALTLDIGWRSRWWSSSRCGWQDRRSAVMSCVRCVALQEFHCTNDQQYQWPCPFEARATQIVEQEQDTDRDHDGRPHDASHLASVAGARDAFGAE